MLDMKHPKDCDRGMERAICASDLDSAVSLFAANAVFISDDGTQVSGLDQIREKLRLFMGLQSFQFTKLESFTNEDAGISLLIGEWVGETAEGVHAGLGRIERCLQRGFQKPGFRTAGAAGTHASANFTRRRHRLSERT